jgi:hypothetical protein
LYVSSRWIFPALCLAGGAACDDEPPISRINAAAEFEPATVDFGEVTLGTSLEQAVALKTTSGVPFTVASVEQVMSFQLRRSKEALEGFSNPPGALEPMTVTFFAESEGLHEGDIKLIAQDSSAILHVRAVAVARLVPQLVLVPDRLDFGAVEIGREATLQVSLRNDGNAPGTIEGATLESTGMPNNPMAQYSISTPLPVTVMPGAAVVLDVKFRAIFEGMRPDRLTLTAAAPHGPLNLFLGGVAQAARGGLICEPSAVNFGPLERGTTASRTVRCTARGGLVRFISAAFPPGETMFAVPPLGAQDLADGQGIDLPVEFRPDGLPGPVRSTLSVQSNGATGMAQVDIPVNGEITPPPVSATAISIVLRWDTNFTDMDLHFLRPGGSLFATDESDCYFNEMSPDWGVRQDRTDDPFLDTDDTNGYGPENINLSRAAAGNYRLFVHSFSDLGFRPTRATIEVWLSGTRVGTYDRTLDCNDVWEVGTVQWNGSSGSFMTSGALTTSSLGSCP